MRCTAAADSGLFAREECAVGGVFKRFVLTLVHVGGSKCTEIVILRPLFAEDSWAVDNQESTLETALAQNDRWLHISAAMY